MSNAVVRIEIHIAPRQRTLLLLKNVYSIIYNSNESKSYSNYRRYTPSGVPTTYQTDISQIISFNHMVSNKLFYTLNISNNANESQRFLYDDELNINYQGAPFSSNGYSFGGTSNSRNMIQNQSNNIKLDITGQINQTNQMLIF